MMRQRLVGTLVLLCGGVILWSLLFTGPAEYKLDRSTQIPPAPRIEAPEVQEPQKPKDIPSALAPIVEPQQVLEPSDGRYSGDGVKAAAALPERPPVSQNEVTKKKVATDSRPAPTTPAAKPAAPTVSKTPPAEPSKEARGLPVAWVIQCGSFGQQSNADNLVQRLRKGGYKADSEPLKRGDRTLYRVLVGPALSRERAEALQAEINRRFSLKSILSRFEG